MSNLFDVVGLDLKSVQALLHSHPPPDGYHQLNAIERAAFMFYFKMYGCYFTSVQKFKALFNRELYKYLCDGMTDIEALKRICEHTREEFEYFKNKTQMRSREAYDHKREQLFTDDERETPISRISGTANESLNHRSSTPRPHAIYNCGPSGRIVLVDPTAMVVMVPNYRDDDESPQTRRLTDDFENFKGPLLWNETPTHTVRLFIERQICRILRSDVFQNSPASTEASDCLLIWQLLLMLVQQQGRVTGPDLARLLISSTAEPNPISESGYVFERERRKADPKAYQHFTEFLLQGHKDEAISCAMENGLYADAFALARRVYPDDHRRLDQIEAKLLAQRPAHDPVLTMMIVAAGNTAAVLTNPPTDDPSSWRSHAAIILANLTTAKAMDTVYHLGKALARRELHSAADFCFIAVNLLAGFDVFRPVFSDSEDEQSTRQHIDLIHATIPGDQANTSATPFEWNLADLQATEIYSYVTKLANNGQPTCLSHSVAFQTCRMQYAQMLAEIEGMATDAYRYYIDIVKTIWNYANVFPGEKLVEICDAALHMKEVDACADGAQNQLFESLKQAVLGQVCSAPQIQPQQHQQFSQQAVQEAPVEQPIIYAPPAPQPVVENPPPPPVTVPTPPVVSAPATNFVDPEGGAFSPTNNVERPSFVNYEAPVEEPSRFNHYHSNPYSYSDPSSTVTESTIIEEPHDVEVQHDYETFFTSPPPQHVIPSTSVESPRRCSTSSKATPSCHTPDPHTISAEIVSETVRPPPIPHPQPVYEPTPLSPRREPFFAPSLPTPAPAPELELTKPQMPPQSPSSQQMPPPQQQRQALQQPAAASTLQDQAGSNSNQGGQGGWFSSITKKIVKAIPGKNEMKLPDDSNQSIRWDENLKKWVGEGVEDLADVAPPPVMTVMSVPTAGAVPTTSANPSTSAVGPQRPRIKYVASLVFATNPSTVAYPAVHMMMGSGLPLQPTAPGGANFMFIPDVSPEYADRIRGESTNGGVPAELSSQICTNGI